MGASQEILGNSTGSHAEKNIISDRELIEISIAGSSEAFAELYERYGRVASRLASFYTADPRIAQGIVAEAFDRVRCGLTCNGTPIATFRAHLMIVLRNVVDEWMDRSGRQLPAGGIGGDQAEGVAFDGDASVSASCCLTTGAVLFSTRALARYALVRSHTAKENSG
ncbi:hypothetical protein GCM10010442_33300 [Kitasatospora kifunensis]